MPQPKSPRAKTASVKSHAILLLLALQLLATPRLNGLQTG